MQPYDSCCFVTTAYFVCGILQSKVMELGGWAPWCTVQAHYNGGCLPPMPFLRRYYYWLLDALLAPSFSSPTLAPAVAASLVVETISHHGTILDDPQASIGHKHNQPKWTSLIALLG